MDPICNVFIRNCFFQGEGVERLLIKGKKPEQVEEVDGDDFRYYLLAGKNILSIKFCYFFIQEQLTHTLMTRSTPWAEFLASC